MNKHLLLSLTVLLLGGSTAFAQQKIKDGTINTSNLPNKDAILELETNNKGLLHTRVSLIRTTNAAPLSAHVAGMMVYNLATANDVIPGIYYNDGTKWVFVRSSNSILVENQPGKTGTPGIPGTTGGPGAGVTIVTNDSGSWVYNPTTNTWTNINGPKGEKGDIGATGLTGATGSQGLKGEKRDIGATGSTGATGLQGLKGDKGDIGATGAQGLKGDVGATGATGSQGPIGLTGAVGATGAQGDKGDKGDKGDAGATGATGSQGPIGLTGAVGATGAQGDKGDKGDKGDAGATGVQGPAGPATPQTISHTLNSNGNVLTSDVNGIAPTANIINTNALALDATNKLTSTVNGISSNSIDLSALATTANNGLTKTGINTQLGGALIAPTTITADVTNTLAVAGLQTGATSDKLVVADPTTGVLKSVDQSSLIAEPFNVQSTTNKATLNNQNIYQNGNLGLGDFSTANPIARLDVRGAVRGGTPNADEIAGTSVIGENSIAVGYDNRASGFTSVAFGSSNNASGY